MNTPHNWQIHTLPFPNSIKSKRLSIILSASLMLSGLCLPEQAFGRDYGFRDKSLSDDARIDSLISVLTLDEKIHLLSTDLGVERLGIPRCGHFEGLHGLTLGGPAMWGGRKKDDDGKTIATDSYTTIFPQSYGLGCTWSPELVKKVGEQTAEEARYYFHKGEPGRGALVMRAPNADLARDPRWGRTEESFGEDPCLTAALTVAHAQGLQGENPDHWKAASLMKHFLANSNEDGRDSTSSDFDNRLFYEYYSYPFYKGITEGGSECYMASYNAWNGTPMTVHPCIEDVTREKWGAKGIVCTDGGALKLLVEAHKAFPTMKEGAAEVVKASVGQFLDRYEPHVREALDQGILTEKDIEKAIRGNIYVALKLGLLDAPGSPSPYNNAGKEAPYLSADAKALARDITAKSVVMLKNSATADGGRLLPLDAAKIKKIAVIGPYADKIVQDWYSGTPAYEVTILDGIRNALGDAAEVIYVPDNSMGQAEKAAADADVAIVCVGNHPFGTRTDWKFCPVPSDGREAVDRKSLTLPDEDMLKLVYKANPNTVLVLVSSFPYAINWSNEHIPSILHVSHCSQEQGNGVADVIFGKENPAGRTVQTWVKDIADLPTMMDYDIRNGRTYMYYRGEPLYPFGYGLSYTDFKYSDLKPAKVTDKEIVLSFKIANTGKMAGDEVAQVYVSYPKSKVSRPIKQLRAFRRINVEAGKTETVEIAIPKKDLGYWSDEAGDFVVEPGKITVMIGASSSDIRLTQEVKI